MLFSPKVQWNKSYCWNTDHWFIFYNVKYSKFLYFGWVDFDAVSLFRYDLVIKNKIRFLSTTICLYAFFEFLFNYRKKRVSVSFRLKYGNYYYCYYCSFLLLCHSPIGIGYAMLVISFLITVYYNAIIAWVFYFLFESFRSDVPWRDCDNPWNTENCYEGPPSSTVKQPLNKTVYNATMNSSSVIFSCPDNFKPNFFNISGAINVIANCSYVRPPNRVLPAEEFLEYVKPMPRLQLPSWGKQ